MHQNKIDSGVHYSLGSGALDHYIYLDPTQTLGCYPDDRS